MKARELRAREAAIELTAHVLGATKDGRSCFLYGLALGLAYGTADVELARRVVATLRRSGGTYHAITWPQVTVEVIEALSGERPPDEAYMEELVTRLREAAP